MRSISEIEDETLLLCMNCGFWGGRGFREWNSHFQAIPRRAVLARYHPLEPIDKNGTEYLVTHLRRFPSDMTRISPLRAEKFVIELLADYLKCEVRAI